MSRFKVGDKVVVVGHPISMFNGHEGRILALKPQSSSFDYHVKLAYNGAIFGFNDNELEPSE